MRFIAASLILLVIKDKACPVNLILAAEKLLFVVWGGFFSISGKTYMPSREKRMRIA